MTSESQITSEPPRATPFRQLLLTSCVVSAAFVAFGFAVGGRRRFVTWTAGALIPDAFTTDSFAATDFTLSVATGVLSFFESIDVVEETDLLLVIPPLTSSSFLVVWSSGGLTRASGLASRDDRGLSSVRRVPVPEDLARGPRWSSASKERWTASSRFVVSFESPGDLGREVGLLPCFSAGGFGAEAGRAILLGGAAHGGCFAVVGAADVF